jgi:TPR repeat protein
VVTDLLLALVTLAVQLVYLCADYIRPAEEPELKKKRRAGGRSRVEIDRTRAARLYRAAAELGTAEWQRVLANCLRDGLGLTKDVREAARYYRLAADQGNVVAQSQLGFCLEWGIGVDKREGEAVRYYRLAADQGDAIAQFQLGFCLERGVGVSKNEVAAAKLYRAAADQGNAVAQTQLGFCLERGTGMAKRELGRKCGHCGKIGLKQDDRKYCADCQRTAAQFLLGMRYYRGQGVRCDPTRAAHLFRAAADGGNAQAQDLTGFCLGGGVGVAKDEREAVRYYRMAADQGHARAQHCLGVCYNNGEGVDHDPEEAARWLLLAAKQGFPEAIDACRALELGRKCAHCGKIGLKQDGLKYCAGCKTTAYCSPEHQQLHWKMHKPECRSAVRERRSASEDRIGVKED